MAANTNSVAFTIVDPPAVGISQTCQVEMHLEFSDEGQLQGGMKVMAKGGNETWELMKIDETQSIISVDINTDRVGTVAIYVESDDGRRLSNTVTILAVLHIVAEDLQKVFETSQKGVIEAARTGTGIDNTYTVAELEENPLLAKKVAWRAHFQPMVLDYGMLLERLNMHRELQPQGLELPGYAAFREKMTHVLAFMVQNHAYRAGNFLMNFAAAAGETFAVDGEVLSNHDLALEELAPNFQE